MTARSQSYRIFFENSMPFLHLSFFALDIFLWPILLFISPFLAVSTESRLTEFFIWVTMFFLNSEIPFSSPLVSNSVLPPYFLDYFGLGLKYMFNNFIKWILCGSVSISSLFWSNYLVSSDIWLLLSAGLIYEKI